MLSQSLTPSLYLPKASLTTTTAASTAAANRGSLRQRHQQLPFRKTLVDGKYKVLPVKSSNIPSNIIRPRHGIRADGTIPCAMQPPSESSTWPRFEVKAPELIERMRRAALLAGKALNVALEAAKPGVTTTEIDDLVIDYIVSQGAYPSGINYMGFPRAVHGIPDTRPLEEGDIVNMDVTCYIDGVYGDTSDMAIVGGNTDIQGIKLINATHRALEAAIKACKPGLPFNTIAKAVVKVAREEGFTVNPQFCGHFIGTEMHLLPNILHTPEHGDMDEVMQVGQVFTIEPVLCEGVAWSRQWNDGWTYVTVDNGRAAQAEHMVNITPEGAEILTKRPGAVGCEHYHYPTTTTTTS